MLLILEASKVLLFTCTNIPLKHCRRQKRGLSPATRRDQTCILTYTDSYHHRLIPFWKQTTTTLAGETNVHRTLALLPEHTWTLAQPTALWLSLEHWAIHNNHDGHEATAIPLSDQPDVDCSTNGTSPVSLATSGLAASFPRMTHTQPAVCWATRTKSTTPVVCTTTELTGCSCSHIADIACLSWRSGTSTTTVSPVIVYNIFSF